MAYKIEIINNALRVTDTVTSEIEINQSSSYTWYKEESLKNDKVFFYGLLSNGIDTNKVENNKNGAFEGYAIEECVDTDDVVFTASTFRDFSSLNLGKSSGGSASIPTSDIFHGGFVDYNDLGTTASPIAFTSASESLITNDTLGAFTNESYLPEGVTSVFNPVTNQFDFTQLKLGDMMDIRFDANVSTNSQNQNIKIIMYLGVGTAGEYSLPFADVFEKSSGSHAVVSYNGIYMGDVNTLNNPAEFRLVSDGGGEIVVNGFYCKILRKG